MMAHDICQELREISERLLRVSDIDTDQIKTLQDISSAISAQVAVQSTCAETIKSIKEGNTPVRRITFNVKRLSDGSKESAPRWSKLQDLDFNSMVFCLLSFSAIVALPAVQFDWLVCNVKSYLETQGFSKSITEIAQVRRVIMNTPKHEKTKAFLEGYHKSEIEIANEPEPPQKRRLVGENPVSTLSTKPLTFKLTAAAAEVILSHTPTTDLVISFPQPTKLPFITVPHSICTKIMATYTSSKSFM